MAFMQFFLAILAHEALALLLCRGRALLSSYLQTVISLAILYIYTHLYDHNFI